MPIAVPPEPSSDVSATADVAVRWSARLWLAGKVSCAVGVYAGIAATLLREGYLTQWLALLGAALLLLAAALFDGGAAARPAAPRTTAPTIAPVWTWFIKHSPASGMTRLMAWYAEYRSGVRALILAGGAIASVTQAWFGGGGAPRLALADAAALISVACAVSLIILERWVAAQKSPGLPGAAALSRLLRLPIVVLVVGALAIFLAGQGLRWTEWWVRVLALAIGLVALEIAVRAVVSWFDPRRFDGAGVDGSPPLVDSALVGALRPGLSPWRALCEFGVSRFGIDLRQSWGLRFIARTAPIFVVVSLLIAYGLSAVTELQPNQRGVYERFGRPLVVLQPGLHLGLPWPFGRVVLVENGVLHEVAVVPPADAGTAATQNRDHSGTSTQDIDPMPSESANRLWDGTHAYDATQLIAGQSNERESFQIMNVDARFVYRVGPTDADALAASYQVADLPALIRDLAGRALIRQFSSDTLSAILGASQDPMARDLKTALQADLDRLHSGIQIVAVVIEAIHPPGGAAAAYHAVQAAELTAQALIFAQQGQAAQTLGEAQQAATVALDSAIGDAAQTRADAHAIASGFGAAQIAYRDAGNVFLREEYLHALDRGLPRAQLVIVDHRIAEAGRATIDLRGYGSGGPDLTGVMHNAGDTRLH